MIEVFEVRDIEPVPGEDLKGQLVKVKVELFDECQFIYLTVKEYLNKYSSPPTEDDLEDMFFAKVLG